MPYAELVVSRLAAWPELYQLAAVTALQLGDPPAPSRWLRRDAHGRPAAGLAAVDGMCGGHRLSGNGHENDTECGSDRVIELCLVTEALWQLFHLRPEPHVQGSLRPRWASCLA